MSIRTRTVAAAIAALTTIVGCGDSAVPSRQQSAEDTEVSLSVQPDSGGPVVTCPLTTAELESIFHATFEQYYENSFPCEFYSENPPGSIFRVNFADTSQSISSVRGTKQQIDDMSNPSYGEAMIDDFPEFGPGAFVTTYEPTGESIGDPYSFRDWSYYWSTSHGSAALQITRWEDSAAPVPSNEAVLNLARELYGITDG